jgi:glucose dehydrogenase
VRFLRVKTILLLALFLSIGIVSLLLAQPAAVARRAAVTALNWPSYGNDLGAMRYVDLDQINSTNVSSLTPRGSSTPRS